MLIVKINFHVNRSAGFRDISGWFQSGHFFLKIQDGRRAPAGLNQQNLALLKGG